MQPGDFITSDTHWFHTNIIKYNNRPFRDVKEMDEQMILRWNAKVPYDATVYHLGDLALMRDEKRVAERVRSLLPRLNGKIRFFPGNHDRWMLQSPEHGLGPKDKYKDIAEMFEWFRPYGFHESKTQDGVKIVMCHYAFDVWNKSHHSAWMLHGHSHGNLPAGGRVRMDVGVDCHPNYEPFSFYEIRDRLKDLKSVPRDHHGRD